MLREIGRQLDRSIFPQVKNGGIVTPIENAVPTSILGREQTNGKERKRRPETRPRAGTTRRQRQTSGYGSANQAAPIISSNLQAKYEAELETVHEAYPHTHVWHQEEGLWLLTESALLPGLWKKAIFLTGIPFDRTLTVRSWGFWFGAPMSHPTWIGPRHTNYDGSVCAFEQSDGTWVTGDSIVELLDLYTLWALRHHHLQSFGRWPGHQVVHLPFERTMELTEDEYCGCGESGKRYGECCREKDLARDQIADAAEFGFRYNSLRKSPDAVMSFVRDQQEAPVLSDLLACKLRLF